MLYSMEELEELVEQWAEATRKRLINNLKRRKVVGQFSLIKEIDYDIKTLTLEQLEIEFSFKTKRVKSEWRNGRTGVRDPLFRRFQPFEFRPRKRAFLKKADIYKRLQRQIDNLIAQLSPTYTELARNIIVDGIFEDGNT